MAGYTRFDVTNQIADTNVINAAPLNGEFDAVEAAFNAVSGHRHDGSSAEGAPITVVGPAQDVVVTTTTIQPKVDNTIDLGTPSLEFKDLWIDGTANIDNLVADAATVAGSAVTTVINTQTLTNKTINLTNNTLVATSAQLAASLGDETGFGVVVFNNTPTLTTPILNAPNIDGGSIDSTTIGGTTPAGATFTTLAATSATVAGASVTTVNNVQTLTGKTINLSGNTLIATSAQLAAALTDETGFGVAVFNNSPTLTSPTINGSVTFSDAAQARSALSTPATPISSGVGQWATLAGAVGGAFSVPAGGTWAIGLSVVDTTGALAGVQYFTGVVAGGTSVWPGVAGQRVIGFGWRVS